ncbi:MAG TPA: lipoate--protein ligase family protein [Smithellaceae bacterium]|nr:lipoate--protein ligase family protein [Smithellaceae bacterium]HRS90311.1 lipoate--protein ligase family protein [Smithellaceae bacterium]HRV27111.1 lipoate--protein ligase family protein [Smithellaceae bacterium]
MAWRLIQYGVHSIFESMAIDEAIFLHTIKNNASPTLRFYSTSPEAVSLGYFQDAGKEINLEKCQQEGVDVVRRITGGKAVFHFQEITYCVTAASGEPMFPKNIAGTYNIISACLARGLGYLGIEAFLAEGKRKAADGDFESFCFASPSQNELLVEGRKICGSAQMRKHGGFLQHGSLLTSFDAQKTASLLLPDCGKEKAATIKKSVTALDEHLKESLATSEICAILKKGFADQLGIELKEGRLTAEEEKLKNILIKKYVSTEWNMKIISMFRPDFNQEENK